MAGHGRALIDPFGAASTITGTSRHDVPIDKADIAVLKMLRDLQATAEGALRI